MKSFPKKAFKDFPKEFAVLKKLNTPQKIQDFLDTLTINFEKKEETYRSPLQVIQRREAHCMEGAMLAAAALWLHGEKPLLLDLKTGKDDVDHVVALFKHGPYWGAISKTNHGVLRYRDPIYKSVRELVMSYFHEYFLDNGRKTLRTYSAPFDLSKLDPAWLTSTEKLDDVAAELDDSPHFAILEKGMPKKLRLAHDVEREAGKVIEWDRY